MILRSPSSPPPDSPDVISAWKAIQRTQQQAFPMAVDLVTQPSHAVLAGEIAEKLSPGVFGVQEPVLAPAIIQAISLHDSGWGAADAQQIIALRGTQSGMAGKAGSAVGRAAAGKMKPVPVSFLAVSPQEAIQAWTTSIEIVAKLSELGACLVSSHFSQLAESIGNQRHAKFIAQEKQRRERLLRKIGRTPAEAKPLVEILQFCDELSLYLCCGTRENVRFPQHGGIQLQRDGDTCVFAPAIFPRPQEFKFAALRIATDPKDSGGREIVVGLR